MMKIKLYWKCFLLWIGAEGMLLASAGCAKQEATEPTMQLDMVQMLETARGGHGGSIQIPQRLQTNFQSDDGKIIVSADATVTQLGDGVYPIVRVSGTDFSQETVDRLLAVLLPDAQLVNLRTERIQEDVLDSIEYLTGRRARYEAQGSLDLYDREMALLEAELKTVPESVPVVPYTGKLHTMMHDYNQYSVEYQGLHVGESAKDMDAACYLRVENNSDQSEPFRGSEEDETAVKRYLGPVTRCANLSYYDNRKCLLNPDRCFQEVRDVTGEATVNDLAQGHLQMTPVQAEEQVTLLLQNLGISARVSEVWLQAEGEVDDNHAFLIPPTEFTYSVRCISTVGNVPQLPIGSTAMIKDENGLSVLQWTYENVTVMLNDNGILQLDWISPHIAEETMVQAAKLMPFSEIQSVLEKMLPVVNADDVAALHVRKLQFEITRVYLGMMRITEGTDFDHALLVPAWGFYGVRTYTNEDGSTEQYDYGNANPILVINAVDGTVIDYTQGY